MRRSYTIDSALSGSDEGRPWPDVAAIRAVVPRLAEHPTTMGADGLDEGGGAQLAVTVDSEVVATARIYSLMLGEDLPFAPGMADQRQRIEGLLDQEHEVGNIRSAAEVLDADLGDTDRFAGRLEQQLQDTLLQALRGLLSGTVGDLTPAQRDSVAVAAREVLGLAEETQKRRQQQLQQTREAQAQHAAAEGEIDAQEHLAQTVLALKHDRPVDDATLDEALRTFSTLPQG